MELDVISLDFCDYLDEFGNIIPEEQAPLSLMADSIPKDGEPVAVKMEADCGQRGETTMKVEKDKKRKKSTSKAKKKAKKEGKNKEKKAETEVKTKTDENANWKRTVFIKNVTEDINVEVSNKERKVLVKPRERVVVIEDRKRKGRRCEVCGVLFEGRKWRSKLAKHAELHS